jgi:hypothetical protein
MDPIATKRKGSPPRGDGVKRTKGAKGAKGALGVARRKEHSAAGDGNGPLAPAASEDVQGDSEATHSVGGVADRKRAAKQARRLKGKLLSIFNRSQEFQSELTTVFLRLGLVFTCSRLIHSHMVNISDLFDQELKLMAPTLRETPLVKDTHGHPLPNGERRKSRRTRCESRDGGREGLRLKPVVGSY